jgi:hypothetical protein
MLAGGSLEMKRLFAAAAAALLVLSFAGSAIAAPPSTAPGKNPLTCFGDGCTQLSKSSIQVDTTSGGRGGGYLLGANNSFYGVRLSQVDKLSVNITGSPLGIDPRFSIPIDENNDGYTEAFVFVASADCNNGAGLVDVINDATCLINYGENVYPNWYTFSHTAGTNFEISAIDNYALVVADGSGAPGVWTISNLQIGKPGK